MTQRLPTTTSIAAAITSDTHFGDDSTRDDWTVRQDVRLSDEFYALAPLVHACAHGKFVFDGDIGDCLRYKQADVRNAHIIIRRLIRDYEVVVVYGNHDETLWPDRKDHLIIGTTVGNVWIEHGYKHDSDVHFVRWAGRKLCRALAWIGSVFSPRAEDWLNERGERLVARGRYGDPTVVREGVARSAREHGCVIAVCGHTHESWMGEIDGVRVIDIGTWHRDGWVLVGVDGSVCRWMV